MYHVPFELCTGEKLVSLCHSILLWVVEIHVDAVVRVCLRGSEREKWRNCTHSTQDAAVGQRRNNKFVLKNDRKSISWKKDNHTNIYNAIPVDSIAAAGMYVEMGNFETGKIAVVVVVK